jgi:CP family cyanate transporter-like MFS transporter
VVTERQLATTRPSPVLTLVAMVAVAGNLRTLMASVPPLVDAMAADLGMSHVEIGVLTTLPVLCMGVFAPTANVLGRRIGAPPAVLVAVLLLLVGFLARGVGTLPALYLGSFVAGAGIATAGTLLPGLVKQLVPPGRAGAATGAYMFAMSAGAAASAALSVPLARALGSWQASLASWSVLAAVGLVAWLPLVRSLAHRPGRGDEPPARPVVGAVVGAPSGESARRPPPDHRLPWREPTARLLALYMAASSVQFYSSLAWLAPTYVGIGWQSERAGYLLSVFSAVQIASGLAVPVLADRVVDRRVLLVPVAAFGVVGELGIWLAPDAAPWLWAASLGVGQGAAFSLGLMLLVAFADSPAGSARLSALVLGFGYTVAAFGPATMGAIRDATGAFDAVWQTLLVLMGVQVAAALTLGPHRRRVP